MKPIEETHPSLTPFDWNPVFNEPDYEGKRKDLLGAEDVQRRTVDKTQIIKFIEVGLDNFGDDDDWDRGYTKCLKDLKKLLKEQKW